MVARTNKDLVFMSEVLPSDGSSPNRRKREAAQPTLSKRGHNRGYALSRKGVSDPECQSVEFDFPKGGRFWSHQPHREPTKSRATRATRKYTPSVHEDDGEDENLEKNGIPLVIHTDGLERASYSSITFEMARSERSYHHVDRRGKWAQRTIQRLASNGYGQERESKRQPVGVSDRQRKRSSNDGEKLLLSRENQFADNPRSTSRVRDKQKRTRRIPLSPDHDRSETGSENSPSPWAAKWLRSFTSKARSSNTRPRSPRPIPGITRDEEERLRLEASAYCPVAHRARQIQDQERIEVIHVEERFEQSDVFQFGQTAGVVFAAREGSVAPRQWWRTSSTTIDSTSAKLAGENEEKSEAPAEPLRFAFSKGRREPERMEEPTRPVRITIDHIDGRYADASSNSLVRSSSESDRSDNEETASCSQEAYQAAVLALQNSARPSFRSQLANEVIGPSSAESESSLPVRKPSCHRTRKPVTTRNLQQTTPGNNFCEEKRQMISPTRTKVENGGCWQSACDPLDGQIDSVLQTLSTEWIPSVKGLEVSSWEVASQYDFQAKNKEEDASLKHRTMEHDSVLVLHMQRDYSTKKHESNGEKGRPPGGRSKMPKHARIPSSFNRHATSITTVTSRSLPHPDIHDMESVRRTSHDPPQIPTRSDDSELAVGRPLGSGRDSTISLSTLDISTDKCNAAESQATCTYMRRRCKDGRSSENVNELRSGHEVSHQPTADKASASKVVASTSGKKTFVKGISNNTGIPDDRNPCHLLSAGSLAINPKIHSDSEHCIERGIYRRTKEIVDRSGVLFFRPTINIFGSGACLDAAEPLYVRGKLEASDLADATAGLETRPEVSFTTGEYRQRQAERPSVTSRHERLRTAVVAQSSDLSPSAQLTPKIETVHSDDDDMTVELLRLAESERLLRNELDDVRSECGELRNGRDFARTSNLKSASGPSEPDPGPCENNMPEESRTKRTQRQEPHIHPLIDLSCVGDCSDSWQINNSPVEELNSTGKPLFEPAMETTWDVTSLVDVTLFDDENFEYMREAAPLLIADWRNRESTFSPPNQEQMNEYPRLGSRRTTLPIASAYQSVKDAGEKPFLLPRKKGPALDGKRQNIHEADECPEGFDECFCGTKPSDEEVEIIFVEDPTPLKKSVAWINSDHPNDQLHIVGVPLVGNRSTLNVAMDFGSNVEPAGLPVFDNEAHDQGNCIGNESWDRRRSTQMDVTTSELDKDAKDNDGNAEGMHAESLNVHDLALSTLNVSGEGHPFSETLTDECPSDECHSSSDRRGIVPGTQCNPLNAEMLLLGCNLSWQAVEMLYHAQVGRCPSLPSGAPGFQNSDSGDRLQAEAMKILDMISHDSDSLDEDSALTSDAALACRPITNVNTDRYGGRGSSRTSIFETNRQRITSIQTHVTIASAGSSDECVDIEVKLREFAFSAERIDAQTREDSSKSSDFLPSSFASSNESTGLRSRTSSRPDVQRIPESLAVNACSVTTCRSLETIATEDAEQRLQEERAGALLSNIILQRKAKEENQRGVTSCRSLKTIAAEGAEQWTQTRAVPSNMILRKTEEENERSVTTCRSLETIATEDAHILESDEDESQRSVTEEKLATEDAAHRLQERRAGALSSNVILDRKAEEETQGSVTSCQSLETIATEDAEKLLQEQRLGGLPRNVVLQRKAEDVSQRSVTSSCQSLETIATEDAEQRLQEKRVGALTRNDILRRNTEDENQSSVTSRRSLETVLTDEAEHRLQEQRSGALTSNLILQRKAEEESAATCQSLATTARDDAGMYLQEQQAEALCSNVILQREAEDENQRSVAMCQSLESVAADNAGGYLQEQQAGALFSNVILQREAEDKNQRSLTTCQNLETTATDDAEQRLQEQQVGALFSNVILQREDEDANQGSVSSCRRLESIPMEKAEQGLQEQRAGALSSKVILQPEIEDENQRSVTSCRSLETIATEDVEQRIQEQRAGAFCCDLILHHKAKEDNQRSVTSCRNLETLATEGAENRLQEQLAGALSTNEILLDKAEEENQRSVTTCRSLETIATEDAEQLLQERRAGALSSGVILQHEAKEICSGLKSLGRIESTNHQVAGREIPALGNGRTTVELSELLPTSYSSAATIDLRSSDSSLLDELPQLEITRERRTGAAFDKLILQRDDEAENEWPDRRELSKTHPSKRLVADREIQRCRARGRSDESSELLPSSCNSPATIDLHSSDSSLLDELPPLNLRRDKEGSGTSRSSSESIAIEAAAEYQRQRMKSRTVGSRGRITSRSSSVSIPTEFNSNLTTSPESRNCKEERENPATSAWMLYRPVDHDSISTASQGSSNNVNDQYYVKDPKTSLYLDIRSTTNPWQRSVSQSMRASHFLSQNTTKPLGDTNSPASGWLARLRKMRLKGYKAEVSNFSGTSPSSNDSMARKLARTREFARRRDETPKFGDNLLLRLERNDRNPAVGKSSTTRLSRTHAVPSTAKLQPAAATNPETLSDKISVSPSIQRSLMIPKLNSQPRLERSLTKALPSAAKLRNVAAALPGSLLWEATAMESDEET